MRQSLLRLFHPNIIPIFEVGILEVDREKLIILLCNILKVNLYLL